MENRTILMGISNIENHYMTALDGTPVEAFALRLFDPTTRLWSIYWADSRTGILDLSVVGSFEGDKGYFFANDHFNGREILLQFEWDVQMLRFCPSPAACTRVNCHTQQGSLTLLSCLYSLCDPG